MKKLYFVLVTLLVFSAGCKKSQPQPTTTATNTEIIATSTGTFNIKIIQILPTKRLQYTEVNVDPTSSWDKKLLVSSGDEVSAAITGATAPVHLVIMYKSQQIWQGTSQDDFGFEQTLY